MPLLRPTAQQTTEEDQASGTITTVHFARHEIKYFLRMKIKIPLQSAQQRDLPLKQSSPGCPMETEHEKSVTSTPSYAFCYLQHLQLHVLPTTLEGSPGIMLLIGHRLETSILKHIALSEAGLLGLRV